MASTPTPTSPPAAAAVSDYASDSDESTTTSTTSTDEQLTPEEKFVVRHTPRQEPQGREVRPAPKYFDIPLKSPLTLDPTPSQFGGTLLSLGKTRLQVQ